MSTEKYNKDDNIDIIIESLATQQIRDHYGNAAVIEKIIEECSELIHAIQKYKLSPDDQKEDFKMTLLNELADVCICIDHAKNIFDDGSLDKRINFKLRRTLKRISNELKGI